MDKFFGTPFLLGFIVLTLKNENEYTMFVYSASFFIITFLYIPLLSTNISLSFIPLFLFPLISLLTASIVHFFFFQMGLWRGVLSDGSAWGNTQ